MVGRLRGRALVRTDVALLAPGRAAVRMRPCPGRWPDHARPDRLVLAAGAAAWAIHRLPEDRGDLFMDGLRPVSAAIAGAGAGALPSDLVPVTGVGTGSTLALVPWDDVRPGSRAHVAFHLDDAPVGPVVVLRDAPRHPAALAPAALAVLLATAEAADAEGRLAIGLGIEGVLAWYRESHRMASPRDAVTFALAHARDRLAAAGRPAPADLAG
jgi:hypothetical protein